MGLERRLGPPWQPHVMEDLSTLVYRWIVVHPPQLWAVVLVALVLAWIECGGHSQHMRRYDAWWLFNLRRSDTKFLRPRRS
jgi:hypothetical protein